MRQKLWQRVVIYTLVIFWCFVCLFPFYWLFTTSLKNPLDVSRGPKYVPFVDYQPTSKHWQYLFGEQGETFFRQFRNSLIAATGSTLLAVTIGAMGGYGLARYRFRWRFPRLGQRRYFLLDHLPALLAAGAVRRALPPPLLAPEPGGYAHRLDPGLHDVQYSVRRLDHA